MTGSAAEDMPSIEDVGDARRRRAPVGVLVRSHLAAVLATALVLATVAVVGVEDRWLMAALVLSAPCVAAAVVIDVRLRLVPTPLTWAAAAVGMVVLAVAAIASEDATSFVRALAGSAVVGVAYLGLWRFVGMGLGDVRLAAALGLFAGWAGWQTLVAFLVLPFLIMLPAAFWQLVRGRRGHVPFAPAIVAGLYVAVALAPAST